jgi:programmed cell death protein 5
MADDELAALRAKRLAEMKAQHAGGGASSGGGGSGGEQQQEQMARAKAMEEQRGMMLSRLLTREARSRLHNIALVKPQKARAVEDLILNAARSGQVSPQRPLDDDGIVSLLRQISEQEQQNSAKVVVCTLCPLSLSLSLSFEVRRVY